MAQHKTLIIVLVTLIVGFGAGFVLRLVIAPVEQAHVVASPAPAAAPAPAEPRGKPYFAAHLDAARQVLTQCAEGSVRGDECFNAEIAVTEADGRARHKRFFGN
ncbi:hypothetical protein FIV32_09470 [Sphingomonadales bacterium 58]|uniref:hypothetical protein n=1 Tax=Sphingobium sp. S8 TaxID=2758385 RepID=UPI001917FDA2|nr:hypothetical protein [Sphingobium sp. S8]MBY2958968.1 hypothetical protein [Sphingomonadales bacterium 58]CAD7338150.1 hypothetical protein SPHS8_01915 [Sphingobium sp. S8]